MKLKDLIFNREKLRKYDQLNDLASYFRYAQETITGDGNGLILPNIRHEKDAPYMPQELFPAIIETLEAKIKKLDEE